MANSDGKGRRLGFGTDQRNPGGLKRKQTGGDGACQDKKTN